MKSNKGITLTSVIVYVIGMTVIVGLVATLTSYFYKNINVEELSDDTSTQYTKFSSIFTKEINKEDNYVIDAKTTEETINGENTKTSYIIFSSGNQYTYKGENKAIYKNNIKICQNIDRCDFFYSVIDGKKQVKVNFKAGTMDFTNN